MNRLIFAICSFLIIENSIDAQIDELGKVKWHRNFDYAKEIASTLKKPMLILFQEVPGCNTCKKFGKQVLSHPLIVETIEEYFVPVCIYNNAGGKDKEALLFFKEPAWNNPVIRVFDYEMREIANRLSGNYSLLGLISTIQAALIKQNIMIPKYFDVLDEESYADQVGTKKLVLGMHCFWNGEKTFGKLHGVINTDALYVDGSEAVQVTYNPFILTEAEVIHYGKQHNCADKTYPDMNIDATDKMKLVHLIKKDRESKYYLFHTAWAYIPMTNYQATLANSLLGEGKDCSMLFSKQQLLWYTAIHQTKSLQKNIIFNQNIMKSWYSMEIKSTTKNPRSN